MDAITGEARNSLSEEKLLRQHLDVNIVEGAVENGNDVIPIKLLDTDTISQAKEKILDVLYRNAPVSRRPQLSEVDLELRRGNAGIKLHDHDSSNQRDEQWVKVNTLGHYKLDQMVSGSGNQLEKCTIGYLKMGGTQTTNADLYGSHQLEMNVMNIVT